MQQVQRRAPAAKVRAAGASSGAAPRLRRGLPRTVLRCCLPLQAVKERQLFERAEVSRNEALDMFQENKFKVKETEKGAHTLKPSSGTRRPAARSLLLLRRGLPRV